MQRSVDPAIRRLAGDAKAGALASPLVRTLLQFPDVHPYKKWWGTHWRLVELADLRVAPDTPTLERGVEQELNWLASPRRKITLVNGLVRRCASMEGNAVYACAWLGFASDPRVRKLADWLIEWQWPDGGWNCDVNATGRRSSFHETVTPALGLAAYSIATKNDEALACARRAAALLLEHRMFKSLATGRVIHPSWTKPHYPPYWHYDILQGLRLLEAVDWLHDPRAGEALDILENSRRPDGRFSGPAWWTADRPDAVDWGRAADNDMLNVQVEAVLRAAERTRADA